MFRLNKKTEYGILALQYLAALGQDRPATVREISEAQDVPQPLLAKVLQELAKSGLIVSVQGAYGGYLLSRKAAEITLAQAVTALEGPIRLLECGDEGDTCSRQADCTLKSRLDPLQQHLENYLHRITLADMAASVQNVRRNNG